MGLLGTVLGFIRVFMVVQHEGKFASMELLTGGVWEALLSTAAGLVVAIPAYVGYNYLVSRVNAIVLDMEKSSTEIVHLMTENGKGS